MARKSKTAKKAAGEPEAPVVEEPAAEEVKAEEPKEEEPKRTLPNTLDQDNAIYAECVKAAEILEAATASPDLFKSRPYKRARAAARKLKLIKNVIGKAR